MELFRRESLSLKRAAGSGLSITFTTPSRRTHPPIQKGRPTIRRSLRSLRTRRMKRRTIMKMIMIRIRTVSIYFRELILRRV